MGVIFEHMKEMHPTQAKLLQLLKENMDNPLTMLELSSQAGIVSPGVFYHHLRQLEAKGYLKRNPNNPKDYNLLDTPDKAIVYVKEYGLAQCGPGGLLLDGSHVNIIPLPSILLRFPASEAFIVKAKGDSMEPKIHNGDLVIARMQDTAEDGDIVVCVYNEQARIKKLFKQNGVVGLESLNKNYKLEIVTGDLKIEGIVKNIHSFK